MFCTQKLDIYRIFIYLFIYLYMVFTTEEFLEVATESWPEWDLKPQLLNPTQML